MQKSSLAIIAVGAILVQGLPYLRSNDPKTAFGFKGFDQVSVSNGIQLTVALADDFAIQAVAKQGDLKRLRIKRRGDTLLVERKRGWGFLNWFIVDEFHVTVEMPNLKELEASGGANAQITRASSDVVEASSSASVQDQNLTVASFTVDASSGANISPTGSGYFVKSDVSSGANIDLSSLRCATATLEASSGANLSAFASAEAKAEASSGASNQIYEGGTFASEMSSGGTVRPAN